MFQVALKTSLWSTRESFTEHLKTKDTKAKSMSIKLHKAVSWFLFGVLEKSICICINWETFNFVFKLKYIWADLHRLINCSCVFKYCFKCIVYKKLDLLLWWQKTIFLWRTYKISQHCVGAYNLCLLSYHKTMTLFKLRVPYGYETIPFR